MSAVSSMNTVRVAAVFAASSRPRQVQLSPRVFQILSRPSHQISQPQHRSITVSAVRNADVPQETSHRTVASDGSAGLTTPAATSDHTQTTVQDEGANNTSETAATGRNLKKDQQFQFRQAMRTVPHCLAIVTARRQDVDDVANGTLGATVSSFSTVSFDPDIIVSFNLTLGSVTLQTIQETRHFCLTFPSNNTAGAKLAHEFTQGNDPPPLTKTGPTRAEAKNQPDSIIIEEASRLKHYPSPVTLEQVLDPEKSGVSFACWCEYQTAIEVGDHAIVTAKVLPESYQPGLPHGWGKTTEATVFAPSHVTLAWLHGSYSNPESGGGVENSWKYDDNFLSQDLTTSGRRGVVELAVHSYRSRLTRIQGGLALRRGRQDLKPNWVPGSDDLRAADLPDERLKEYEDYYMQRLQVAEAALARFDNPNHETRDNSPQATAITGWRQLYVRNKALLSDEELDKEEALYAQRIAALESQGVPTQTQSSQQIDEEKREKGHEAKSRNEELMQHFQERLYLTREARRAKRKTQGAPNIKRLLAEEQRYLGTKRNEGLQSLEKQYRRYQTQIMEARISLAEAEHTPGKKDTETIKMLRDRVTYFTRRSDMLMQVIEERHAKTESANSRRSVRLPPITKITEVQERKTKIKDRRSIGSADDPHKRHYLSRSIDLDAIEEKTSSNDQDAPGQMTTQGARRMHEDSVALRQSNSHGDGLGVPLSKHSYQEGDPLVMRHFEGEVIPSAAGFIKMRQKEKGAEKKSGA